MKNSYIPPNLVNVKYTNFKTISFYCIFTHTEYLSYIWSPLHLKSVKTISLYWRLYLYIIIRLHLNVRANVTCDLFVLVVTWMQTRKNIDQGIHKYWMCPYCYTVNCPSHCILGSVSITKVDFTVEKLKLQKMCKFIIRLTKTTLGSLYVVNYMVCLSFKLFERVVCPLQQIWKKKVLKLHISTVGYE